MSSWNFEISQKKFIKLLVFEKHIYNLGFHNFPSVDYNRGKLLLFNINLRLNLLSEKKYRKFLKNNKNTYLFIPNVTTSDKFEILQIKDIEKCSQMKVENSLELVCSAHNRIPYIIINKNIIDKLHRQVKYSSKMYINDLIKYGNKEIACYQYSKQIDKKYKNEISKQLLVCFSKTCCINKEMIKIKITIKPKMVEFTFNREVTKHDLQKFSLPPMKLMIRKPVNVSFDFY